MSISKLFCILILGLAITGFTTLSYASHEESHHAEEVKSEAESALEKADVVEDSAQSTEDIQYGAKSGLEEDEKEVEASKTEEKE
ncbi:MAG: hypothetical protein GY777_31550 [Candidatus Brocadiaceae bacterium]|nr:hypothetical protein [Candidatus Brocadiaceae bacterium]